MSYTSHSIVIYDLLLLLSSYSNMISQHLTSLPIILSFFPLILFLPLPYSLLNTVYTSIHPKELIFVILCLPLIHQNTLFLITILIVQNLSLLVILNIPKLYLHLS